MDGYQGDDVTSCSVKYGRRRQQRGAIEFLRHEEIKQVEILETSHRDRVW